MIKVVLKWQGFWEYIGLKWLIMKSNVGLCNFLWQIFLKLNTGQEHQCWRVRPPDKEGSCELIALVVMDNRQGWSSRLLDMGVEILCNDLINE